MALVYRELVKEESTTTGNSTYTLAGRVGFYRTFSVIGNANTCYYHAYEVDADGNPSGAHEWGLGTYTLSGTTLARTTIMGSFDADGSNNGSAISWAAGTRHIICTELAEGTKITRQPGGTVDVDELHSLHDGTDGKVETKSGDLLLRLPINKAVRVRPAATSADQLLFACEDASGTPRFSFNLGSYLCTIGGIILNGNDGTMTINSEIRRDSYAIFSIVNATLKWPSNSPDLSVYRVGAGVLGIGSGGESGGAALSLTEISEPSNPAANSGVVFVKDSGGGKSQLCVRFGSGVTQVVATEP
jgi:hypothetical protein